MDDKLFIIAIGGTGMRCLEAFVHLCAAGMFDNKTIDILTLDTDQSNGNKARVEGLIDLYNRIKTSDNSHEGGDSSANTFFSAKLNLFRFYTEYSEAERKTLKNLINTRTNTPENREDNRDLTDLFFDNNVQEFPLDHGYRAQTHLGSMLMYHGILEAAIKAKKGSKDVKDNDKELQEFIQLLYHNSANARVFVFGSVFGGTGASSIPVIPIALRDALKVLMEGKKELNLNKVMFGSTLLTDYFKFDLPDDQQRQKDRVIADASNFALNSQAALNFYNSDITVKQSYKRLYHIGWPASLKIDYSQGQAGNDVITGGKEQQNPCHVVELMCAAAAYDFFTTDDMKQPEAKYLYRSVEEGEGNKLRLTGASFVGEKDGLILEQKLGTMLSLAHLILSRYNGAQEGTDGTIEFLEDIKKRNVENYADIKDEQARQLDEYLKIYAYSIKNGQLAPGWLHQVKNTIDGSFIFSDEALSLETSILNKVDPGAIYKDEKYNWQEAGLFGKKADKRFDKFIEVFKSDDSNPTLDQGNSLKEKFLGHLYKAITKTQKTPHTNRG